MHRQIIAAAAATLLFFTLTGCGDDAKEKAGDDPTQSTHTADETKAIDSLTTLFGSKDNASSAKFFGPEFPHCFAETLVDEAGADQLVEDKVLTAEFEATDDFSKVGKVSDESAAALATAEYDCIDWDEVTSYLKENNPAGKNVDAALQGRRLCGLHEGDRRGRLEGRQRGSGVGRDQERRDHGVRRRVQRLPGKSPAVIGRPHRTTQRRSRRPGSAPLARPRLGGRGVAGQRGRSAAG